MSNFNIISVRLVALYLLFPLAVNAGIVCTGLKPDHLVFSPALIVEVFEQLATCSQFGLLKEEEGAKLLVLMEKHQPQLLDCSQDDQNVKLLAFDSRVAEEISELLLLCEARAKIAAKDAAERAIARKKRAEIEI